MQAEVVYMQVCRVHMKCNMRLQGGGSVHVVGIIGVSVCVVISVVHVYVVEKIVGFGKMVV